LYAKNLLTFLTTFWDKDAKAPRLPAEDDIIRGVMLTRGGAVVHKLFEAPPAAAPAAPPAVSEPEPTPAEPEVPTSSLDAPPSPADPPPTEEPPAEAEAATPVADQAAPATAPRPRRRRVAKPGEAEGVTKTEGTEP
jgi:hypothetical protein